MKLEIGGIEETVFYGTGDSDLDYEIICQDDNSWYLTDFSIDPQGRVRKGTGIVNMVKGEDEDMRFVPAVRYEVKHSAWNSHSQYIEMELPNPATEPELYKVIRTAMLAEFKRRYSRQIKNAKARLKTRAKSCPA